MGKGKIGILFLSHCRSFDKRLTEMISLFPIVAMATERLKYWLEAFKVVYSVERVWPMGLWFVTENHMLDWQSCQICYPLELNLLLLLFVCLCESTTYKPFLVRPSQEVKWIALFSGYPKSKSYTSHRERCVERCDNRIEHYKFQYVLCSHLCVSLAV